MTDPEGGPVTIADTTSTLPSFVTFSGGTFSWTLTYSLPPSQNLITFRGSDGINNVDKQFFINITNQVPKRNTGWSPTAQSLNVN
jgi:hypothetical protein